MLDNGGSIRLSKYHKIPFTPSGGESPAEPPLPRHRDGEHFIKGPIPLDWIAQAASLPGKALTVGLALWYRAGIAKGARVKCTTQVRESLGIKRKALYNGLRALAQAGLISVDKAPGRSSVVTILGSTRGRRQTPTCVADGLGYETNWPDRPGTHNVGTSPEKMQSEEGCP